MEQISRRRGATLLLLALALGAATITRLAHAQPSPAMPKPAAPSPAAPAPTAGTDKDKKDKAEASAEKPAAEKAPEVNFTIENSLSMRDPFRRPTPNNENGDGATIPELERFELDKLRLVGVITGPKQAKALISTPGGKMHIVAEEARLGTRHGIIKKIAPGMISVEEKVVNLLGQEENIETVLEFKEKVEEKEKKE